MSHVEKYQAGEAYGAVRPSRNPLLDPIKMATAILGDYAGVRKEASLMELAGLIRELALGAIQPLDDKKG
ncbi:hypothetical protein IMZ48_37580 [Candidatus Bathyarchaeota archaeon]|nr:hypothetical protein [Candidatus Bathyarchaeota archaeon]